MIKAIIFDLDGVLTDTKGVHAKAFLEALRLEIKSLRDADADDVARTLRLFYANDLRDLQDRVNGILAKAQNFVASPKTNNSLGKVGR